MAMNHIAVARNSSRRARASEERLDLSDTIEQPIQKESPNETSQNSVISMSSSDGGDFSYESSVRRSEPKRDNSDSNLHSARVNQPTRLVTAPLDRLETVADIQACVDADMHRDIVLDKLERRWIDISTNVQTVLTHLQSCSEKVAKASTLCLVSLGDSIDLTCEKVDGEVKALYHLMAKCDELTTKLSAASSFRNEIKTLRKSVEALELLYKQRPQTSQAR